MTEFQERLSELLEENNLSRLKLANIINITSTTINGYFNKNYYPTIDIAIKMANYFNCSLDYLFGLTDKRNKVNLNNQDFLHNFNLLLNENKLSISKAMKYLQMSEYNYYRWKKGMFPKTNNLVDIAKYFGTSIDFLVGNKMNEDK